MLAETARNLVKDSERKDAQGNPLFDVKVLAAMYKVTPKTVVRVLRGESAAVATGIVKVDIERPAFSYPQKVQFAFEKRQINLPLRAYFGFQYTGALRWGMYDGHDGVGYAATDGYIVWRHEQLALLIKQLGGEELPTFGLENLLDRSIGDYIDNPAVDPIYLSLAETHRLSFREPTGGKGFVYLTSARSQISAEEFSSVAAAVALGAV